MYYGFQFKDGTNTTTVLNGKNVIAGQLMKFHSIELRDAWVDAGYNYRSDCFRKDVTTKTLPHGWNPKMAEAFMEEEELILKVMGQINADWLEPCEMGEHGHWAYADDARDQEDFSRRLSSCETKAQLKKLRKEEKDSVLDICSQVKELLFKAMATPSAHVRDECLYDARRLWGCYGSSAEVDAIEDILSPDENILVYRLGETRIV